MPAWCATEGCTQFRLRVDGPVGLCSVCHRRMSGIQPPTPIDGLLRNAAAAMPAGPLPTSNFVYHRAPDSLFAAIQTGGLKAMSGPDGLTEYKFISVAALRTNTATLENRATDWHFRLRVSDMIAGDWVEMANKSEWRGRKDVPPELLEYRTVRPQDPGKAASWQRLKAGVPAAASSSSSSSTDSKGKEEKKNTD